VVIKKLLVATYLFLFTLAIEPEERRPGLKLASIMFYTLLAAFRDRV